MLPVPAEGIIKNKIIIGSKLTGIPPPQRAVVQYLFFIIPSAET